MKTPSLRRGHSSGVVVRESVEDVEGSVHVVGDAVGAFQMGE